MVGRGNLELNCTVSHIPFNLLDISCLAAELNAPERGNKKNNLFRQLGIEFRTIVFIVRHCAAAPQRFTTLKLVPFIWDINTKVAQVHCARTGRSSLPGQVHLSLVTIRRMRCRKTEWIFVELPFCNTFCNYYLYKFIKSFYNFKF